MKSNIFIPKTINVGFQNRNDTYTKKLAYVIYYDQKGVLRKETSWNSWRDKKIEPKQFENQPTSGFVLNKKVGDYVSDWNHRQAYVRVYDPRDFEFEITIENLLYILENASSIKGKGLEGDFIYGWNGKDLILIPTDSPDYKEISQFNEILHNPEKIKSKDLILGATYQTKNNEEWIYLGKFDLYSTWRGEPEGKHYFFRCKNYYQTIKSLNDKIIKIIDKNPVSNYAELMEQLEHNYIYSPIDNTKDEYVNISIKKFIDEYEKIPEYSRFIIYSNNSGTIEQYVVYRDDNNLYLLRNNETWKTIMDEVTLEQIYEKMQPMRRIQYLKNGKVNGGY